MGNLGSATTEFLYFSAITVNFILCSYDKSDEIEIFTFFYRCIFLMLSTLHTSWDVQVTMYLGEIKCGRPIYGTLGSSNQGGV